MISLTLRWFFCLFSSWFLRHRSEPDRRRSLRPPPSLPEHEEDDDEGSLAAAPLGEQAAAGRRGHRGQYRLLRLRGGQSVLLTCDRLELQTARCCLHGDANVIQHGETHLWSLFIFLYYLSNVSDHVNVDFWPSVCFTPALHTVLSCSFQIHSLSVFVFVFLYVLCWFVYQFFNILKYII